VKSKKVLVLLGGPSKERPVSIQSGLACCKALKELGYYVLKLDPKKNVYKNIKSKKPDIILNCLHGRFGEDGEVQKILEKLKIPYTHSGIGSSQKAMDKIKSKKIFKKKNILSPNYKLIKKIKDLQNKISNNKFIIKPVNEGSSFGVKIYDDLNKKALQEIKIQLKKYKILIQEEFIDGQEIQTAVLGNKAIGSVEIKPKRKFYDYKAKYDSSAKTQHIIPVNLTSSKFNEVMKLAYKAHKVIGCRGVSRSDFKFFKGKFYLLEINTQPGMTKLSLVPEIAAHKGINFLKLIEWMLKDASKKK